MEITTEQLFQKIGTMVIMMDIQASQSQIKIKDLEDKIQSLNGEIKALKNKETK